MEFLFLLFYIHLCKFLWCVQGIWNKEHRGCSWYVNNAFFGDIVEDIYIDSVWPNGYNDYMKPYPSTHGNMDDWILRCKQRFQKVLGRPYQDSDANYDAHYWSIITYKDSKIPENYTNVSYSIKKSFDRQMPKLLEDRKGK